MKMKNIINEILEDKRFTDTRYGTNNTYEFSNGNALPYTGVPYGQNYIVVETNPNGGSWWFNPHDRKFSGFRITHQPSPWMGDFSHFVIQPFSENNNIIYNPYSSIFRPNFNIIDYANGEKAIMSASKYGGIIRFESKTKAKFLLKDILLEVEENKLYGTVTNFSGCEDEKFTMYIAFEIESFELIKKADSFILKTNKKSCELKFATSFISMDQAKYNLSMMDNDLVGMLKNTTNIWTKYFDRFEIKNYEKSSNYEKYEAYDRKSQVEFFYHALYRIHLFPMTIYEINEAGDEIHYDTISKTIKKGKLFTNIGFWDAGKTLFPLLSLIDQKQYKDILEGILNSYRNTGYLPKWLSPDERGLMPGTLVDNVIAEASSKDIAIEYMEELLEAMIKSATTDSGNAIYGRAAVNEYIKYGFVPHSHKESVNQTLDNSLSDYSISIVAKNLGKKDIYEKFKNLSKNYLKLFDRETGFLRSKSEDNEFLKDFNPIAWGSPYTEGSAYQNSYNMYHDFDDFIGVFGGKKEFEKRLDELTNAKTEFDVGYYGQTIHEMREYYEANFGHIAISNQPSFHLPYLYNYVDKKFKTEILIKELLLNYFRPNFDAYPGDEDNGSLSAWYILSSLGFYPTCPGSNIYDLGIAFFDEAKIHLDNGNILTVKVNENFHHKKFVNSLYIDGERYIDNKISYEKIVNAKYIEFNLGIVPEV
ncbi:MAG: GH92 family glycosyl hydrolase [Helcococcus sp.]|nr:GH92 family glycosyl hydrolase [Helcococcus sp.]